MKQVCNVHQLELLYTGLTAYIITTWTKIVATNNAVGDT